MQGVRALGVCWRARRRCRARAHSITLFTKLNAPHTDKGPRLERAIGVVYHPDTERQVFVLCCALCAVLRCAVCAALERAAVITKTQHTNTTNNNTNN